jgi:hypothetical protein
MKTYAPIALFVYNRPKHTQQTIEALSLNLLAKQSDLYVFSDAAKNDDAKVVVDEVRSYIKKISGFNKVEIVERKSNYGLANSIIDGVTSVVNQYGKVIVLEDDLVTSPYFLKYMNDGLNLYETNKDVISIHGYIYPVKGTLPETFFLRGADCWGWATWKDKWSLFEPNGEKLLCELKQKKLIKRFDFNGAYSYSKMLKNQIKGKNDSWAIRWYASAFLENKYTLYPGKSLVLNIGNDGSGTHCGETNAFSSELGLLPVDMSTIEVKDDLQAVAKIETYFKDQRKRFLARCMRIIMKKYKKVVN